MVSILLVAFSLPWFNDLAGKEMTMPWTNPWFWLLALVYFYYRFIGRKLSCLVSFIFQAGESVERNIQAGFCSRSTQSIGGSAVYSFSCSDHLHYHCLSTRLQFAKNRPVGYTREGLLMVQKKSRDFYGKFDLLSTELNNTGVVAEMAESGGQVTGVWQWNGGFNWKGRDPSL